MPDHKAFQKARFFYRVVFPRSEELTPSKDEGPIPRPVDLIVLFSASNIVPRLLFYRRLKAEILLRVGNFLPFPRHAPVNRFALTATAKGVFETVPPRAGRVLEATAFSWCLERPSLVHPHSL